MRKALLLLTVFTLALFALIPSLLNDPTPAYAREILQAAPDLSGLNIYFSEANNEASQFDRDDDGISRFAALLRMMGASTFTLEWRKGIPADADLIVIPGPMSDLSSDMVARLWAYIQRGGRVLLVIDAFDARGATSRFPVGFLELTWNDLGFRAREDVVVLQGELQTTEIVETDDDDNVISSETVESPALHTDFFTRRVDESHPITGGLLPLLGGGDEDTPPNLNSLFFDGGRSLEIDGSLSNDSITPLIFADDPTTYGETDYADYVADGFSEYNIGEDTPPGDLILALAYEDPASGSRLVLLNDIDFLRNGGGFITSPTYSGSFVYPLNVHFMVRAVAWLLDREPANISLPTPGPTATPTVTPSPTPTPLPTATPDPAAESDDS
jgi:hypothetical protein